MQLKHISIIPDGNRRWARGKKLSSGEGHRIAVEKTLPKLLEKAIKLKIPYFSFWAMSTDNFKKRSNTEIKSLMRLLGFFLDRKINEFNEKGVKFKAIGDIDSLPHSIKNKIEKAEMKTQDNKNITFIIALNYSGRDEIKRALNKFLSHSASKKITENDLAQFLDTRDIPDPDIIVRTGGEIRLSGFMLWQSEYSELYFSDILFPDFSSQDLQKIVDDYNHRKRRYGK